MMELFAKTLNALKVVNYFCEKTAPLEMIKFYNEHQRHQGDVTGVVLKSGLFFCCYFLFLLSFFIVSVILTNFKKNSFEIIALWQKLSILLLTYQNFHSLVLPKEASPSSSCSQIFQKISKISQ